MEKKEKIISEVVKEVEEKRVESPEVIELKAKIAKYEKEIEAYKITGNLDMAEAIGKEVNNLKTICRSIGGQID